ncbi:tRNA (adenosine(37)-N6)-threonylcarbamoyltransferase complex dimerization subunit type 1 TsaB [candidate division Kazan bacterium RBG_13_50_9]|uniref:tRNA (Adenosine(37)-N6)-threonylcarbamoyltransferase complex dimerization subunit type 1 TsaB n=1 Tax=candidate division Kazan bacterium RBG_13_50_9 TaxID=1798535 RepID=A0A1F4NSE3_UNCK3|nr:MAG: tRNA (adenosine(37)-N6)-threonylcarbamoyltransferase complex dimerization subunit type 1 TsaB [candidate division Kazan bacterium RBG_13_50_9]
MKKKSYVLGIDTAEAETGIGLAGRNIYDIQTWLSHRNQSQELLPKIDRLLKKHRVMPEQLKWVAANLGPGSFTGLRVGISLANAFGYGLNIPVVGKKELLGNTRERVGQLLKLRVKTKSFKQVLPYYGRPPRITHPKK